jgi:hypothetical protein
LPVVARDLPASKRTDVGPDRTFPGFSGTQTVETNLRSVRKADVLTNRL